MKIDFHTHGKLSKNLPFSVEYTKWLFNEAENAGLDALCLTEHFNTLEFADIYKYIASNYERRGDVYLLGKIKVFPGMEIDISEGGHILTVGSMEDILELNSRLGNYKEKDKFLSFYELLQILEDYNLIVGAAHPFRNGGNIPSLPVELLRKFDFIDLNGKDYAGKGAENESEIRAFAQFLDKPVLADSDTHQSFQYGCIWNDFKNECYTIDDLRNQITEKAYDVKVSDYINQKVRSAVVLKKALKQIYNLGGDFVPILLSDDE